LRPAFCLLGALAAGGADGGDIRRAGAALEMLHAMALFHDDVIDGSTSRRGRETTHVRHARLHREGSWAGEATRFGEGVAILVGDLAYVYADQLMASMSPRVREVWTRMRLEVNLGQYLDVKTAKYTIERPLHIGAMIADPAVSDTTLDALSGYGVSLGIAFQMRDDILGVFGEPGVTGKPAGDDLRESKPTALVAEAVAAASTAQRSTLALIGTPNLDASQIDEIRSVIVATGALDSVESRIAELTESAIRALDVLDVRDDVREKFSSLAHAIAWRSV
jgi:geranylgeranyl diphosphate synthase type I